MQPSNLLDRGARHFRLIVGVMLLVLVSGCGSAADRSSTLQPESNTLVGTNGQLIPIQSDNVQAAGYDANSMIMTVQFDNGYTYEYYEIPAELWNSFVAAQPHPWSQIGYPRLVKGGYQYKKIN